MGQEYLTPTILDGAWWPRTRGVETELPSLIRVLTEHLGPITRVGVDASARDGLPARAAG